MSDAVAEIRAQGFRPGVGVMLLDPGNRVFVGRRIDVGGDNWQMPQGGIDAGETPREAAFRELKEEIGTDRAEIVAETPGWLSYELPPELAGRAWKGKYRGQMQKWFAMRFTGRDDDIRLDMDHPEFDAWKWVPPEELPRLIVPFKRQLYTDILREFAAVLKRR